jgi:hypothetical protein
MGLDWGVDKCPSMLYDGKVTPTPRLMTRSSFINYLEDIPELQPDSVLLSSGPDIGTDEPEPPARDAFQPNDIY